MSDAMARLMLEPSTPQTKHGKRRSRCRNLTAYQTPPAYPTASVDVGISTRTGGVPCLVPAIRNERLPKDFKGPRKVPNYTADLQPAAWIESYEMAMELLEVSEAAMAKYFTMMLDGTARTWLKRVTAELHWVLG